MGTDKFIEVLMGIHEKDGMWLMAPVDGGEGSWHNSRAEAMAHAAEYAAIDGEPFVILADNE